MFRRVPLRNDAALQHGKEEGNARKQCHKAIGAKKLRQRSFSAAGAFRTTLPDGRHILLTGDPLGAAKSCGAFWRGNETAPVQDGLDIEAMYSQRRKL